MRANQYDLPQSEYSLVLPEFEKDSCGFGLIAHMDGQESSWLISAAIESLSRLSHRGAVSADGKTGDGCGLLFRMPRAFMSVVANEHSVTLGKTFAVGSVFFSQDPANARTARNIIENALQQQEIDIGGWRSVPVDTKACGVEAIKTIPNIEQLFVSSSRFPTDEFERRVFVARRFSEISIAAQQLATYIPSFSSRLISYKALVLPEILPDLFPDLRRPDLKSSICLFHQRFSTNTDPRWELAQPMRYLAHNGEINTISGNRNWMMARRSLYKTPLLERLHEMLPLVGQHGSDSFTLDNMLELLMMGGKDIFVAMRTIIPPAWQNAGHFDPDLRSFYEYASAHTEPWDGPAGIALTDGRHAACILDRNGLRPVRYVTTRDRHILLASEIGVYDFPCSQLTASGRLGPGEMIAVDTQSGRFMSSSTIDTYLKNLQPYRHWVKKHIKRLSPAEEGGKTVFFPHEKLGVYEKMFGLTFEEKEQVLKPLANLAQEATGSMGDDTPLPVLSRQVRSVFDNFRQQFAQVTNPPIDSLREKIVMSLETALGEELNPFVEMPEDAFRLVLDSPVLSEYKFSVILQEDRILHEFFDINIDADLDWAEAIVKLTQDALDAVKHRSIRLVVLSDRNIQQGKIPLHMLLVCGALHHLLVREGLRAKVNIILETAVARDPHHFSMLISCGATAIFPYLSYQTLYAGHEDNCRSPASSAEDLTVSYRAGVVKGIYKILSKMGISAISSYRGSQLFEIVGLSREVSDLCFTNAVSRIGGASLQQLKEDQLELVKTAWMKNSPLRFGGLLKFSQGNEYHAFHPEVVHSLHQAVRSGEYSDYQKFSDCINNRPPTVLRDLLDFCWSKEALPLSEVESAQLIVRRFDSAGMSLGALSKEAHEVLAEAMNDLGGRSNSGEGGEDAVRFSTNKVSKIKQVASGRFGVTPHFLVNAEVLQIKIAQGAKPGEGGQLPGAKVDAFIAGLRHASPGISLISPPPHHDIYSIEDLAQLIFDLKQVNPRAFVSVKLVAEPGVGTVATGVAKAYADFITISGYDGGTGASPLTSIKYAGSPWELGLPETHQALCRNNLRSKVRLQTDGGLKTGVDVVKAALLGAESFGFGTAPMIAMGCKYLRICHLNNCATGVATQHKTLRFRHFIGKADMVKNYFMFVAEEVRQIMARLGIAKFNDLIGHTELLKRVDGLNSRQNNIDFSSVLLPFHKSIHQCQTIQRNTPRDKCKLAQSILGDAKKIIAADCGGELSYKISNIDRSIGANLSGEIAKKYGSKGLKRPLYLHLKGFAGQSFGAWNSPGLFMSLEGAANDYVGKGMAGGEIIIRPSPDITFPSSSNVIVGNTCLYGATGGSMFLAGTAGERFAVRNSGATAVVEGAGQHCCEYMTGGAVIVLGKCGRNFAAGMTGGLAYVLDMEHLFADLYNNELVETYRIDVEYMGQQRKILQNLIYQHAIRTKSQFSLNIHERFAEYLPYFWLIKPKAANISTLMTTLQKTAS